MGDLQAQLYALEGQLEARQEKTNQFAAGREAHMELGQKLSVRSALDRGALANSMNKMRSNLTNNKLELEVHAAVQHSPITNHHFLPFLNSPHSLSILSLPFLPSGAEGPQAGHPESRAQGIARSCGPRQARDHTAGGDAQDADEAAAAAAGEVGSRACKGV